MCFWVQGHTAFGAYEAVRQQQAQQKGRAWKIWLVAGDCFLIGLAPVSCLAHGVGGGCAGGVEGGCE